MEYFVTLDAAAIFILMLPLNRIISENKSISVFFHKTSTLEYGMFLCSCSNLGDCVPFY